MDTMVFSGENSKVERMIYHMIQAQVTALSVSPKPGLPDRTNRKPKEEKEWFSLLHDTFASVPFYQEAIEIGFEWELSVAELIETLYATAHTKKDFLVINKDSFIMMNVLGGIAGYTLGLEEKMNMEFMRKALEEDPSLFQNFSYVIDYALPELERVCDLGHGENLGGMAAFAQLLSTVTDPYIIIQSNEDMAEQVRDEIRSFLNQHQEIENILTFMRGINRVFLENQIRPFLCESLLMVTFFLYYSKQDWSGLHDKSEMLQ